MDFPSLQGPSQASFDALQAQLLSISPLGPFTVATLPIASVDFLYRLATVTDLFGNRATRMRCERLMVGGEPVYYWQPQSSDSSGTLDASSANLTIGALTMPTSLVLTGALGLSVSRTVTFADGAYPGQTKEITNGMSMGALSGLNLLGTGLGSGLAFLLGGYSKFVSDWTTTPGQKLWRKIVG